MSDNEDQRARQNAVVIKAMNNDPAKRLTAKRFVNVTD